MDWKEQLERDVEMLRAQSNITTIRSVIIFWRSIIIGFYLQYSYLLLMLSAIYFKWFRF